MIEAFVMLVWAVVALVFIVDLAWDDLKGSREK